MRKVILFTTILFTTFILSSCYIGPVDPIPYGKWHSDDPDITFELKFYRPFILTDEEYLNGTYIKDDEIIRVNVMFSNKPSYFEILPLSKNNDGIRFSSDDILYFSGQFGIKSDKLYCYLDKKSIGKTGYKEIVFDLVEEYSEQ